MSRLQLERLGVGRRGERVGDDAERGGGGLRLPVVVVREQRVEAGVLGGRVDRVVDLSLAGALDRVARVAGGLDVLVEFGRHVHRRGGHLGHPEVVTVFEPLGRLQHREQSAPVEHVAVPLDQLRGRLVAAERGLELLVHPVERVGLVDPLGELVAARLGLEEGHPGARKAP